MRRCLVCNFCSMVEAHAPLFPVDWRCEACQWSPRSERNVALLAPELADDTLGFDSAAFSDLEAIEDGHFWFEPRNRLMAGLTERFFPAARSYLEIGCGTGFVFRRMAARANGPDLSVLNFNRPGCGLHNGAGKPAEWLQMDARSLPVREEFDLLGCYDVLEHVQDDGAVLEEVYAALRPGGGAILAVPQHPMLWSALDERVHHVRRYRRDELEKKAKAAGFRVLFPAPIHSHTLPTDDRQPNGAKDQSIQLFQQKQTRVSAALHRQCHLARSPASGGDADDGGPALAGGRQQDCRGKPKPLMGLISSTARFERSHSCRCDKSSSNRQGWS